MGSILATQNLLKIVFELYLKYYLPEIFVWEKMKVVIKAVVLILVITILVVFSSCSENKKSQESMVLSQMDIDLLVQHKKSIDRITKKFDKVLSKTKKINRPKVISTGKTEINNYLKSNNLDPVFFMRKSKKILKGYIAFIKTDKNAVKKREAILKEQNLSEKEIKTNLKAFKRERERSFKELTSGLSDYEIELIRTNLKKISSVVNF